VSGIVTSGKRNRSAIKCLESCTRGEKPRTSRRLSNGLAAFFIKLLCPPDGLVVDPFAGSGTTGLAAISQNRRCLLIDNNATYCQVAQRRLSEEAVSPKSNGQYPAHESNGHEQVKLLDAPSSKPMPKSKPVRYSISKRKK
jgi:DNA modification methylase